MSIFQARRRGTSNFRGSGGVGKRTIRINPTYGGMVDALDKEMAERKEWRVRVSDCQEISIGGLLQATIDTDKDYLFSNLADDWTLENTPEQKRRGVMFSGIIHHFDAMTRTIYFEDQKGLVQPDAITECLLLEPDYIKVYREWANESDSDEHPNGFEVVNELIQSASEEPVPRLPKEADIQKWTPRKAQKDALAKSLRPLSLIWGPPGTGKTYTVGLIAAMHAQLGHQVFVLAPTNAAADVATLAIDDAMTRQSGIPKEGIVVRTGRPVNLALEKRKHLLAWTAILRKYSDQILALRQEQEEIKSGVRPLPAKAKGDKESVLARINRDLDECSKKRASELKKLCASAKIIVATIHSAFMNAQIRPVIIPDEDQDDTKKNNQKTAAPRKRTLIFDEASMVSRYVSLPFLETSLDHVVVAGDIRQFKPIRKSQDNDAVMDLNADFWVSHNLFDVCSVSSEIDIQERLDDGVLSILQEQSRMVSGLCEPVSKAYYLNRLVTVNPPEPPPIIPGFPAAPVVLVEPSEAILPPQTPPKIDKAMREGGKEYQVSAWIAVGLAQQILSRDPKVRVTLITPFRKQAKFTRELVRSELSRFGRERVNVGTVHVAQGSEAEVVIFDLTLPGHKWFKGGFPGDSHHRLACVAFSRAKRQMIIVAPEKEFVNTELWKNICPEFERFRPIWDPSPRSVEADKAGCSIRKPRK